MVGANAPENGGATSMEAHAPDSNVIMEPRENQNPVDQQVSADGCFKPKAEQTASVSEDTLVQPGHATSHSENQLETNGQNAESRQEPEQSAENQTSPGRAESPVNMELEDVHKVENGDEVAPVPEEPVPSEFDRLYKIVEDDPEDFNGWVYLLQYVEQEVRLV